MGSHWGCPGAWRVCGGVPLLRGVVGGRLAWVEACAFAWLCRARGGSGRGLGRGVVGLVGGSRGACTLCVVARVGAWLWGVARCSGWGGDVRSVCAQKQYVVEICYFNVPAKMRRTWFQESLRAKIKIFSFVV